MKYKLLLLLALPFAAFAQKKQLSDAQLLQNNLPEISKMLSPARWSDASTYCIGNKCYDAKTGNEIVAQDRPILGAGKEKRVYIYNTDVYYAVGTTSPVQLTNDAAVEVNPTFSPDHLYTHKVQMYDLLPWAYYFVSKAPETL